MTAASEAILTPSARIERRFFGIVRWFGLFLTVVALVLVILNGIGALSKVSGSVDEHLRRPATGYADFQRTVEISAQTAAGGTVDPTVQRKEQEVARAQAELDYERHLKPHLDAIVASLSSYATAVDVGKPSAEPVGNFIRQNMATFTIGKDDGLAWGYVEGMEKAVSDLAADGGRLAKLGVGDARRAHWDQFLQWYTAAYRGQIDQEQRRIATERASVASGKAEAILDFYKAAAAFGVFVLATILLVLLRIERNTRRDA
jgi:hypothetical protein